MPSSSEKPTNTLPGNTPRAAKPKPKASQSQGVKSAPQAEKKKGTGALETAESSARKSGSKQTTTRESKSPVPPPQARPRKLTPQQQQHLARAKRRRRDERLIIGGSLALVVILISFFSWRLIVNHANAARLASAHAAGTSTAVAVATATEVAGAPAVPPAVTGKTVTMANGLQYIDIKVGTGAIVKAGDTISAQYTGWLKASDVKFDSSYDHSPPGADSFQLVVGSDANPNGVIAGWVDGIPGMKVGGERRLIIPAALAYGATGIPGTNPGDPAVIPPNADLIFDVTVVSDASETPTPTTTSTVTPTATPTDTPTASS